ncbi:hypothetical protein METP2_03488 [Methanosarcinales archaeon]|nr:hypothetical protein METP2_03488 [Methanosarcinales archaeon]
MDDTMPFFEFVEINPKVTLKKGIEYPFVEMDIVTPGRRYVSSINKRIYNGGGAKFQFGDTLFARITPCLENGKIAQFSGAKDEIGFGSTEFFVFRHKEGISDPGYIFYLASSDILRKPAEKSMSGASGRQRADIASIKDLEIPTPPLPTQRKIASILSAYDDLIENNTRRIKILEEMAQALYREWFVNFRFPGHEKVKMVESELGMVPKGWEEVTIRDVSSYINRGISPKYDDLSRQIVINQKCIRDGRFNLNLVRRHSTKVPVEKFVKFGDVLINSTGIGTLGRVAQICQEISDCTVDSHVSIVRPNDRVSHEYFGSYLATLEPHFDSQGIGSTGQTELGRETIAKTIFLLPPKGLQDRFAEIVSPMRKNVVKMFIKNINLRRTRDLLLPKLISGEVDVEKIDVLMA